MVKKLYSKWKKVAEKVVNFQIKVVFSVLYFLLVIPVGFFIKRIAPLKSEKKWLEITDNFSTMDKLKSQ